LYTMQAMAERMVKMLREVQVAGPYRLAGWSFGGVLAYEIAQQLLQQRHTVEFLGLFDAFCPDDAEAFSERTPEAILVELCEEKKLETLSNSYSSRLLDVAPDSGFEILFNQYRDLGVLPENLKHLSSFEARLQCQYLEVYLRAASEYRPQAISIPVHVFAATERPAHWPLLTPALGWERSVASTLLSVQKVPGNHYSMMTRPHIQTLGQQLNEAVAAMTKV
jgi:arthrofactin-type cyclic lipopeptide synthetase C